ncbi:hypothetical protein D081_1995 [Anaerovibrio sp. JC8]|nr:hypothetical protein D081_1995 [Anaerovibrio sp. JC8]
MDVGTDTEVDGINSEVEQILYYAGLAPSSHNAQMWEVKVYPAEGKLVISPDNTRLLTAVDQDNRETYISMGAYARSCMLAFEAYGYNASLHISDNGQSITIIYANSGMSRDEGLLTLMRRRHTDKRDYTKASIPEFFQDGLKGIRGAVFVPDTTEVFTLVKDQTLAAAAEQRDNQDIRDELADWLRFSNGEVEKKKDGLTAEQNGITGLGKAIYYTFGSHWFAKGDTFAQTGYEMAQRQAENCAGYILITANDTNVGYIEAGMHLTEAWLYAVRNDIEVQPMSFAMESKARRFAIQNTMKLPYTPQMVLRVGYVDGAYGANALIRRDLRDYIQVQ